MTVLLDGRDAASIEHAAELLARGDLVAFPTETVYGLGARADDDAAVAKIFAAKGRPSDHPLIVHVASIEDAEPLAAELSPVARRLMTAFWPGPLTLIVRRADGMARAAAAGQSSIGLRCPSHPVALALLAAARRHGVVGVAAPSANRFGRISPTRAQHVLDEFSGAVPVLDGGPCALGIESTIVDVSRDRPVLLRPGMLTRARIEAAAGEPLRAPDADAPRAPGTLASHYAPSATLRLMSSGALHNALRMLAGEPVKLAVYWRSAAPRARLSPTVSLRRMPEQPEPAAHELFAALREFDASGAQLIWVEEPPPGPEWDGVRDRLQRAASA